jgi:hypothetical protein
MAWSGGHGRELTVTAVALGEAGAVPFIDLDAARREHRQRLKPSGAGLVSLERVTMATGQAAIQLITKLRRGLGFSFTGQLIVGDLASEYAVTMLAHEMQTGEREAAVSAMMWQLGEIRLDEIMKVPAEPGGARPVPGLHADPYDSAFDADAVYGPSDDARLDPLFSGHPLTDIRACLSRVRATWVSDAVRQSNGQPEAPDSHDARGILSDDALREIYWASGRNDLLEAELLAVLARVDPAGDSSDPAAGRLLMMLGLAQHNSKQLMKARESFGRAASIMTSAFGNTRRETGVARSLLGRTQKEMGRLVDAESSLKRAIAILDLHPEAKTARGLAAGLMLGVLIEQKRSGEAAPYLARVQQSGLAGGQSGGVTMLRTLLGGAPPSMTAKITRIASAPPSRQH